MLRFRNRFSQFCFNLPEGEGGGAPAVPTSDPSPPEATPAAPTAAAPSTGSTPSWSLRDHARSLNISGLDQFQDDRAFADHMFGRLGETAKAAARYKQFYDQFSPEFTAYQQWKQQQAQAAQQPKEAPKPKWQRPEYDPEWRRMVKRDEEGNLIPLSGADPSLPHKLAQWDTFARGSLEKFLMDPASVILPLIEDRVAEIAQQRLDDFNAKIQPVAAVKDFVAQNADWMYATDQQGRKMYDNQTGRPLWSPAGKMFVDKVQDLESRFPNLGQEGVTSLAMEYVEGQLRIQAASVPQQQADPRQAYTGTAPHQAPASNVAAAAASQASSDRNDIPQNGSLNLRSMMRQNHQAAGLLPQGATPV